MACYPCYHCNKCGMYSAKAITVCKECGTEISVGVRECPNCGCKKFEMVITNPGTIGKSNSANAATS